MNAITDTPHEVAAKELEASGQYRVLRRFVPVDAYEKAPEGMVLKNLMVIDTETTSLDSATGKIIEIGYLLIRFDGASGRLFDVIGRYSGFEDPGHPLAPETTEITGIVDADVAGKSFDDDRIEADIAKADLIIAHNAPFDRGFLELRYPSFENKWWACSQREAPWKEMGSGSSKLEFLAYALAGIFYDAHRALVDAEVLLALLALKAHDERPVLAHILDSTRKSGFHVWATNAPFDAKDALKKNGYKWSDGSDPKLLIKAWHKTGVLDLDAEKLWLQTNIFLSGGTITVDSLSGRERFTNRYLARELVVIPPAPPAEAAGS